jgi:hypothetical protein
VTGPAAATPPVAAGLPQHHAAGARPDSLGWAREHAAQAALVATVVAGGVARLLRRGRGH